MRLTLGTDINGKVDFSLPAPVACEDVPLAANTVATITTPPNFNRAFFAYSPGSSVWVTLDGTAPVVPGGIAASTQELLPGVRQININGGKSIKFISDTTAYVNVRYDLGSN